MYSKLILFCVIFIRSYFLNGTQLSVNICTDLYGKNDRSAPNVQRLESDIT